MRINNTEFNTKYYYNNGSPFNNKLGENIKALVDRVESKKASLLIIDGGVGEGKTTLCVQIADFINQIKGLSSITLQQKNHPQLALGGKDFTKQFRKCYEMDLPCIIYDEAGDFNRRGSLSRFNAMLNRTFETFRGFKIVVILSLPSFSVLDNDIFDKNIPRLLLHLKDRSDKYGNFYGYSLVAMNWVRYWAEKLPKGIKYKCYEKVNPNFYGQFKDLIPERSKALDSISTAGKLEVLKASEIKLEGLINYSDLARKVGRSVNWVRQAVSELRIKESRIINRVKYFKEEVVINMLLDKLDNSKVGGKR